MGIARIGAHDDDDEAVARRLLQERRETADMVAAPDGDRTDAEGLGLAGGGLDRERRGPDPGQPAGVPASDGAEVADDLRPSRRSVMTP